MEAYEKLYMEVIAFQTADVITNSDDDLTPEL